MFPDLRFTVNLKFTFNGLKSVILVTDFLHFRFSSVQCSNPLFPKETIMGLSLYGMYSTYHNKQHYLQPAHCVTMIPHGTITILLHAGGMYECMTFQHHAASKWPYVSNDRNCGITRAVSVPSIMQHTFYFR
jgi:hypothetical protein